MYFVTISEGLFQVFASGDAPVATFEPSGPGREQMGAFFASRNVFEVLTSSSIDHPEDGGLDRDFNAHEFLQACLLRGGQECPYCSSFVNNATSHGPGRCVAWPDAEWWSDAD